MFIVSPRSSVIILVSTTATGLRFFLPPPVVVIAVAVVIVAAVFAAFGVQFRLASACAIFGSQPLGEVSGELSP